MDASELIRSRREAHGLTQARLARRARTTQRQISRIEGGEISPSVATVSRLLAAMGERLELSAVAGPPSNQSDRDLQSAFRDQSPAERVAEAAALSHTLTSLAAAARRR